MPWHGKGDVFSPKTVFCPHVLCVGTDAIPTACPTRALTTWTGEMRAPAWGWQELLGPGRALSPSQLVPLVCQQPWENRGTPCASVSLLITAELILTSVPLGYQGCYQAVPGGVLFPGVPRAAGLLLLLSAARCSVLAAAEPGYKAQDCVAQGLFLPSFPLPGSPSAVSPSRGAVAGAWQALVHLRSPLGTELFTAPEWAPLCHLSGGQK